MLVRFWDWANDSPFFWPVIYALIGIGLIYLIVSGVIAIDVFVRLYREVFPTFYGF
jgi:hypothetical protein